MLEWLKIGFGIGFGVGLGLILALVALALALGVIDALSGKIRLWLMQREAREEKPWIG